MDEDITLQTVQKSLLWPQSTEPMANQFHGRQKVMVHLGPIESWKIEDFLLCGVKYHIRNKDKCKPGGSRATLKSKQPKHQNMIRI